MASIQQDPLSKIYRIRFRFRGRRFFRSLKTKEEKLAFSILGRVEETLRLIEQGRIELPANTDPGKFILSDGKVTSSSSSLPIISLKLLFEEYQQRLPDGAKEPSTISTENTHIKHFLRLMKVSQNASSINSADIQRYVDKRLAEKRGSKSISPDTVKRELKTFSCVWSWARGKYVCRQGYPREETGARKSLYSICADIAATIR